MRVLSAAEGEPAVSARGSDVSALPQQYPQGDWLPIEAPLLGMQLIVTVVVNGIKVPAILDTGAMATTMSMPLAARLGVVVAGTPRGMPVRAIDAHGDVIFGERAQVARLAVGHHAFERLNVTVLGEDPDLFLIGADVLQQLDVFIAADEGLVGVFAAGTAPKRAGEVVVPLKRGDRQLVVGGAVDARSQRARFEFLLDTGAWNTSVPVSRGIDAGLPADLAYSSTTVGVAGEQEARGRFVLAPLMLGANDASVGRVLAVAATMDSGEGLGLLGNDVFMRFHSIISFADATLRLLPLQKRSERRARGPGGVGCERDGRAVPCVAVRLAPTRAPPAIDDWPGVCLQVDVEPAFANTTIEVAVTADDPQHVSLFNGGAIRAFLSADASGAHHCFAIWPQLQRLGLTPTTPLTVRWVRTEGVRWPCDPLKSRCVTFTGPLAKLGDK
jgi:predicted aspartyl protease